MGCLLLAIVVGGGCLLAGWVVFPEPQIVRDFWAKHGWADRD